MSRETTPPSGTFQLLTSPGPAAIAVVRVRGPLVERLLRKHLRIRAKADPQTWTVGRVFRAELLDQAGDAIDDMLVSVHAPAPSWDLRLHLHGSPGVVRCCTELLKAHGLSEQAEAVSTLWHSENTIEAEAHARLPRMLTLRGVQWLMRQGRLLAETLQTLAATGDTETARRQCREIIDRRDIFDWFARPLRVALVGPPNAGKSTLANALADQHVALVSPVPGTTRDWLEIPGEIEGFPVMWLDTAGLRGGSDELEAEAIRRTHDLIATADLALLVLDASSRSAHVHTYLAADQPDLHPACIALNKCDLVESCIDTGAALPAEWHDLAVPISAVQKTGLNLLTARLLEHAGRDSRALSAPAAFTERQVAALEEAATANDRRFRERVLCCLTNPHEA